MRGKQEGRLNESLGVRITPADAGKTYLRPDSPAPPRDHPRGCGENFEPQLCVERHGGSPPRMRGKPAGSSPLGFHHGITPADAGKTNSNYPFGGKRWDHPRGCGENLYCPTAQKRKLGSPPRMRGKHQILIYA